MFKYIFRYFLVFSIPCLFQKVLPKNSARISFLFVSKFLLPERNEGLLDRTWVAGRQNFQYIFLTHGFIFLIKFTVKKS
jgi:hypothetical protein